MSQMASTQTRNGRIGADQNKDRCVWGPLRLIALAYVTVLPLDAVSLLPGRSATSALGLLLIAVWVAGLLSGRVTVQGRERAGPAYLAVFTFTSWVVISLAWSIDPGNSRPRVWTYVALALTVPAVAHAFRKADDLPLIGYVAGATVLAIQSIRLLESNAQGVAPDPEFRANPLASDPNAASLLLLVGVALGFQIASRSSGKRRWLAWISIVLCALGSLATGSKTGAIGIGILAAALVLQENSRGVSWQARVKGGFSRLSFIAIIGLILWSLRELFPPRVYQAFASAESRDFSAREDIWNSLQYEQDLWLPWGVGPNNSPFVIASTYGQAQVAHNAFLEVAIELGLVGLALSVAVIASGVWAARSSPYKAPVFVAMIPLAVFSLSLSMFYFKVLWFILALAVVRVCSDKEEAAPLKTEKVRLSPRRRQASRPNSRGQHSAPTIRHVQ